MANEIMNREENEIMDETVVENKKRFGGRKLALIGTAVVGLVVAGGAAIYKLMKKDGAASDAEEFEYQDDDVCDFEPDPAE